jgi:hypothetical protein
MVYQPKTGAKCSCKKGIQRDNCSNCEGTGMVIDFRRIREEVQKSLAEKHEEKHDN